MRKGSGVQGRRHDRVGELIRQELGQLVVNGIKDPAVQGITITDVRVTPDLSMATVYFAAGDDSAKKIEHGLERATSFLQRRLGAALRLKKVPKLRFRRDQALEEGEHVDSIIREIAVRGESEDQ